MSHGPSSRPSSNMEKLYLCAPDPNLRGFILLITYCSNCTRTWPIKYELGANVLHVEWEACPGCGHKCLPEWYPHKGEGGNKDIFRVNPPGANTSEACNGRCDDDSGKKDRAHASRECRFVTYTSSWRCWACGTTSNWVNGKPCRNCNYRRDTACMMEWNADNDPAVVMDYNYGELITLDGYIEDGID